MAKATKSLSGNSKDKYFRDLFATDPGVAPEAAKRLTETTKREVSQVRVRLPLPERSAKAGHGKTAKTDLAAASAQTVTGRLSRPQRRRRQQRPHSIRSPSPLSWC